MGAGASTAAELPAQLDRETAKQLSGNMFDPAAFDAAATDGVVSREEFLQAAGRVFLKAASSGSAVQSIEDGAAEVPPEELDGTIFNGTSTRRAVTLGATSSLLDEDDASGLSQRPKFNTLHAEPALQNYAILDRIGAGSYGSCYLVRDGRDEQFYCLKQIMLDAGNEGARASAELEVATLRQLDHPSVVSYHEHFVLADSLCLIMSYCEGGDLSKVIKKRALTSDHFPEEQVLDWFVQLAMALHYVHSCKILHRDLKSQNIFLSNHVVKLGDFGIVKVLDGSITSAQTVIGTPYYLSPEVCQSEKYSYKSDVWSLGCILYEMCALQQAWTGNNLLAVVYKIVQGQPEPVHSMYSPDLQQLISRMLSKDPKGRPSLPEVRASPR